MTITERKAVEKQAFMLISHINARYEPEVSNSVTTLHGGSPTNVSSWELEAINRSQHHCNEHRPPCGDAFALHSVRA